MQNEKKRVAWIAALAATAGVLVAVLAYLWPSRAAVPGTAPRGGSPPTVAAPAVSAGVSAAGPTAARYVPEYRNVAFTMPDPGPSCGPDDTVTVTFTAAGPTVGTDPSVVLGSASIGDLFYSACVPEDSYLVAASDESSFARVTGHPTAADCARAASQRPTGKRTVYPRLRPGTSYCLLSNFVRHQVVLVTLTGIAGRDLSWTATAWLDNGA